MSSSTSLATRDRQIARKKGIWATLATAGSVALIATGSPYIGVLALIPSAWLAKEWFMFRARRGMRF